MHSRRIWVRSCSSLVAGIRTSACAGARSPASRSLRKASTVFWSSTSGWLGGVDELQVLGDELDVDEAAAHLLQVPDVVGALLLGDALAHVDDVGGDLRLVARHRRARCAPPRRRERAARPVRQWRGRASAPCAPRSRRSSSGSRRRSSAAWRPAPAGRKGAAACRPRTACPRRSAADSALIRRCVRRA